MKNLFRSASVYRLTAPPGISDFDILGDKPVAELAPGQHIRIGWDHPGGSDTPYLQIPGYLLVCMVTIEKKLKSADVTREVGIRVKKLEAREGRGIGAKERGNIKDEVMLEFLPKTLPTEHRTYGYFDWKKNILVVDQHSIERCDKFTAELRHALGSLPLEIMASNHGPATTMTTWARDNCQPPHIDLVGDAVFKNPTELSQTAKVRHMDLHGPVIGELIKEGMVAQELALEWKLNNDGTHSVDFVLMDTLRLKCIKFSDDLIYDGDEYENAELEYQAALLMTCSTITEVLLACFDLFGGIAEG